MLTQEEDMEIAALRGRGWSVSAIARHTGRDRKTVKAYLAGQAKRRERTPSVLEPYRDYLAARFVDDPHVLGTVLFGELGRLGFDRSYQTFVRQLRVMGLRPVCECCRRGGVDVTTEIDHPPGEELQFDWLELRETPWGQPAYVLIGALSYSGCCRGVFSEAQTGPHVIESLDGVLRRLGGTTRRWRTDRMAGVVHPGSDRLLAEFAACAKHYGVGVDVCPARRAKRKGVAEAAVKYLTRSWWCSAAVATPAQAQMSLDRFCVEVADERRRGAGTIAKLAASEGLLGLPSAPFPAEICVERGVSRSALVAFEGNHYSVPAALAGVAQVTVRARLGEQTLVIVSAAGTQVAKHRRAPSGTGQLIRCAEHAAGLEQAVLSAFTTHKPCRRKQNRPPGQAALQAAAILRGEQPAAANDGGGVVIDLERYAQLAQVAR
jgi:transposase